MGSSSSKEQEEQVKREAEENKRKEDEERRRQQEQQRVFEQERRQWELERIRIQNERVALEQLRREIQRLQQEEEEKFLNKLLQHTVSRNLDLLNGLCEAFRLNPLREHPTKAYEEKVLQEDTLQYNHMSLLFKASCKPCFTITKIIFIDSVFHLLHYSLMKAKYQKVYREKVLEQRMFHGTKEEYLNGICTYNFDRSKVRLHKFGRGVSFARDSYYATHYHHDNQRRNDKVMVIAKVMVGKTEPGSEYMNVPEECYTAVNEDLSVVVKFDDASAYPECIIYYEGFHPTKLR